MSALPSSRRIVLVPRAPGTAAPRRYGIARISIGPAPAAPPPMGLDHLKRTYD